MEKVNKIKKTEKKKDEEYRKLRMRSVEKKRGKEQEDDDYCNKTFIYLTITRCIR